jgi:hypothetical protein
MADTIPSLWPDDIKTTVLTPLAILRVQANALASATKGLLEAGVNSVTSGEQLQHHLDIVAPALDYTHRIVTVTHHKTLVYPALIRAQVSLSGQILEENAAADEELMALLHQVLASPYVRSILSSLIARSNERAKASGSSGE